MHKCGTTGQHFHLSLLPSHLVLCTPIHCMDTFPEAKRKRVAYTVAAIRKFKDAGLQKTLGVGGRKYKARLIAELEATGSLNNRPGQGAHPRYTEEHFFAAATVVMDGSTYWFSTEELVYYLEELGLVPSDTCPRAFWRNLKEYMQSCKLRITFGQRRLTFALAHWDCSERLEWAREKLEVFTDATMGEFTFEDEIVIDCGGKPKGEWGKNGGAAVH